MLKTRWSPLIYCNSALGYSARRTSRCHSSTAAASVPTISPALLGRARALAAEHGQLSKQLNSEYDVQIAKKAGSLSAVAEALNGWESANNVRSCSDTAPVNS